MNCGEEIRVRDIYGAYVLRFIAQCHGRFMVISHTYDQRNGYLLSDWKATLRELVAITTPAKLIDKQRTVEGNNNGRYVSFPLTYPLSTNGLGDLLGVTAEDVRGQLEDLAVEAD
jgi:hypothetical protein